ncbi:hypothetical protein JCM6882_000630 [Rhodosporidiobolus microsporus]
MSPSPSPAPSSSTTTKPKLSRAATPAERQAAQLSKLLAKPDRDIHIPQRPQEGVGRTLRAPREMMKNVQGSSAGAGSGEFHVYKQSRRREYERLKIMDEEEEFERQKSEALARQAASTLAADEKTAKNRLKRQRKKDARGGGGAKKGAAGPAGAAATKEGEETEGGAEKKRKLAPGGGAAFTFKTAEEREGEDGAEEGEDAAPVRRELVLPMRTVVEGAADEQPAEVAAAKEAGITIQDDD